MGLASRTSIPVLCLAAGTWVGFGAPRSMPTSIERSSGTSISEVREVLAPAAPPPTIDASSLPDPVPWPRLNTEDSAHRAWLLAEGPRRDEGDGRRFVTFTFDDGPFPETTPLILKTLEQYHVRATFFFIGRYLDGEGGRANATRAVAKQVAAAGHFVGNHTHDHALLTTITRTQAMAQIDDGAASIERVLGTRPIFFRPPYGQLDDFLEQELRARGAELVLWSIEAQDMKRDDSDAMVDSLEWQIEYAGGGVVLLHDIRRSTVEALPKLLDWLHKRRWDPARPARVGYEVVDLPAYLRATAERPQPFADRTALERARSAEYKRLHPHRTSPPSGAPTELAM